MQWVWSEGMWGRMLSLERQKSAAIHFPTQTNIYDFGDLAQENPVAEILYSLPTRDPLLNPNHFIRDK